MAHIVRMHQPHRDTQELLPWYVIGRLDAEDAALVENHLAGCAECRDAVAAERQLATEISALPLDAEAGWAELRRRIAFAPPRPARLQRAAKALREAFTFPGKLGWVMAAQLAVVLAVLLIPREIAAPYRTLGDPAVQRTGNVIVIFRPDTREAELRRTLEDNRARLVDGPTSAGAYVVAVPAAERAAIVAALQTRSEIVLAQPVDASGFR